MAAKCRENTFRIDFSNLPKRMSYEETHNFVHKTLGLCYDDVKRLQVNHALNCAQVKCSDLKIAQETVLKHNGIHEFEINKVKYKIKLCMDDGGLEIKIHDLSENVTCEQIRAYLEQYGEVFSIKELMWGDNFAYKGVPTGVRVIKMSLQKHIKSYVMIQGEQTLVTYFGQPATCKHCTNSIHPGMTCVLNKKLMAQKSNVNDRLQRFKESRSSYANVLNRNDPTNETNTSIAETIMSHFVNLNSHNKETQNNSTEQAKTIAEILPAVTNRHNKDNNSISNNTTLQTENSTSVANTNANLGSEKLTDSIDRVQMTASDVTNSLLVFKDTNTKRNNRNNTIDTSDVELPCSSSAEDEGECHGQAKRLKVLATELTPSADENFKIPTALANHGFTMEISENEDENSSTHESETSEAEQITTKKGKSRSKKKKL